MASGDHQVGVAEQLAVEGGDAPLARRLGVGLGQVGALQDLAIDEGGVELRLGQSPTARDLGNESKQNVRKSLKEVPAKTLESDAMSKDLQRRGFKFVGSTICYAFMQAVGRVNDHPVGCFRHDEVAKKSRPATLRDEGGG